MLAIAGTFSSGLMVGTAPTTRTHAPQRCSLSPVPSPRASWSARRRPPAPTHHNDARYRRYLLLGPHGRHRADHPHPRTTTMLAIAGTFSSGLMVGTAPTTRTHAPQRCSLS